MPNPAVQQAIDAMTQANSVEDAVLGFFQVGLPSALAKARADAIANGATEAELVPFTQLSTDLSTKAQPIIDAIVANTPVTTIQAKQRK